MYNSRYLPTSISIKRLFQSDHLLLLGAFLLGVLMVLEGFSKHMLMLQVVSVVYTALHSVVSKLLACANFPSLLRALQLDWLCFFQARC